jgi:hypothetical protein
MRIHIDPFITTPSRMVATEHSHTPSRSTVKKAKSPNSDLKMFGSKKKSHGKTGSTCWTLFMSTKKAEGKDKDAISKMWKGLSGDHHTHTQFSTIFTFLYTRKNKRQLLLPFPLPLKLMKSSS